MLTHVTRIKSWFIACLHDILVIPLAWFSAYWLRFNLSDIPDEIIKQSLVVLPTIFIVQVAVYWAFGLYRGVWRFASMPDLVRIVKAVTTAILLSVLLLFLQMKLVLIPRSIFLIYGLLLVFLLGGSRFAYRWYKDYGRVLKGKRVLILGAGHGGEGIVRELRRDTQKKYKPIGFVDDNKLNLGKEIQGVRVLGKTVDIPYLAKRHHIDLVIIAVPSANSAEMRRVVEICEQANVAFLTLPSINDLADGNIKIDSLRAVSLEDLLGRDPISLDWRTISKEIENNSVLVSGGGGSIGSELCLQIAALGPKLLAVVEKNEFNLYALRLELGQKFPDVNFVGYLIDVTDKIGIHQIFKKHDFDIVFHAAAYKHVPMLENQIRVAMRNNIIGTRILAEEAVAHHVKKFVLISTDKAVNPTNVMGATKRAAEIFCQGYNSLTTTQFIAVRFGNVLGSAGSVVPLFRKQIEQGGPLTVTHPEITRFFMTISEAAQLILQSTSMGKGGEVFVLDMGEPIKISYLAEQMIHLSGLVPNKDIEIKYTGLRPGEKLHEELFYESEELLNTEHEKILRARYPNVDSGRCLQILDEMLIACESAEERKLLYLLSELVPEYQAPCGTKKLQLVKNASDKINSML